MKILLEIFFFELYASVYKSANRDDDDDSHLPCRVISKGQKNHTRHASAYLGTAICHLWCLRFYWLG